MQILHTSLFNNGYCNLVLIVFSQGYTSTIHAGVRLRNTLFCSHRSNICCPRDCVPRHNGGAPLKPLRDDSVLRALSSLRGLRGAQTRSNIHTFSGVFIDKRRVGRRSLTHCAPTKSSKKLESNHFFRLGFLN